MKELNADFEEAYFERYGGHGSQYNDPILKKLLRKRYVTRFASRGRLLELGCAYGFLLKDLQQSFDCEGVDISAHAIEVARTVTSADLQKADLADALELRASDSYDVVLAFDILEHLNRDQLPGITEAIARLLRPGGLLLVSVPNWGSVGRLIKGKTWFGFRDSTHTALIEKDEWINLLGQHMKVRSVGGDGLWDAPYFPVIPRLIQKLAFAATSVFVILSGGRFPKLFSENLVIACVK